MGEIPGRRNRVIDAYILSLQGEEVARMGTTKRSTAKPTKKSPKKQ
jgi:hypothetical protein